MSLYQPTQSTHYVIFLTAQFLTLWSFHLTKQTKKPCKTLKLTRLFLIPHTKKPSKDGFKLVLLCKSETGADGGGRTHTMLPSRDFESRASANSTTSANALIMLPQMRGKVNNESDNFCNNRNMLHVIAFKAAI